MSKLVSDYLEISLSAVEFELVKMPSFRADLMFVFSHPTGSLTFHSTSVWFSIEDWDGLVNSLSSGNDNCGVADLSYDVRFNLTQKGLKNNIVLGLRRPIAGVGEGELKFDFDEGSEFRSMFLVFAKSVRQQYLDAQSEA